MATVNYEADIGQLAGGGAGIASGAAALGTASTALGTGVALAGITAGAAAIIAVLVVLFKGADPNEAIASNILQIFEIAGINLEALAGGGGKLGGLWSTTEANPPLISKAEAIAGIQSFQQAVLQYEAQMAQKTGDSAPFKKGIDQANTEMDGYVSAINNWADFTAPTGVINYTACHACYVPQGTPGFIKAGQYANCQDSIVAAWKVTDAYLQSLPRTVTSVVTNTVSNLGGVLSDAATALTGGSTPSWLTEVQTWVSANPMSFLLVVVLLILLVRKEL